MVILSVAHVEPRDLKGAHFGLKYIPCKRAGIEELEGTEIATFSSMHTWYLNSVTTNAEQNRSPCLFLCFSSSTKLHPRFAI